MPQVPPGLSPMLCFDVYAANLAFGRVYAPLLEPLGLTYPQYLALVTLWERDGRTVGEMGTLLGLESNTLTPLLKRLERAGLVSRERDPEDERRVRLALTAAGRDMQARAAHVPLCIARATGMELADVAQLQAALRDLRRALAAAAERGAAIPKS